MKSLRFPLAFPFLLTLITPAGGQTFQGLGFLSNDPISPASVPLDISGDGTVVVGNSFDDVRQRGFQWTKETGMVAVPDVPGFTTNTVATAISDDGTTIVGEYNTDDEHIPFRWTAATGSQSLGQLPGNSTTSASDVSADGSVVIGGGFHIIEEFQAFRWTTENGMENITDWGGGGGLRSVIAISGDGETIIGEPTSGEGFARWTYEEGATQLPFNPTGISFDGSVIVGGDGVSKAMRWTEETGAVPLTGQYPVMIGGANNVSADGEVIIGSSNVGAFVWTEAQEVVFLRDLFVNKYGLGDELQGWQLNSPVAISADGFTIVGTGINPSNQEEAWIATIHNLRFLDGDVNRDQLVNGLDIDTLHDNFGGDPQVFDLNFDGEATTDDVDYLVGEIFATAYGDTNLDMKVDLLDFSTLKNNFGQAGGWEQGDVNGDGVVGLADFNVLKTNFGFGENNAVPEPSSALMCLVGMLFLAPLFRFPLHKIQR